MTTALAITVLLLSLLAWGGQLITAVAPRLAERLALTEPEAEVDPVFHRDVRAECVWDALSLWTLVVAAALRLAAHPAWTLFGLVGGGMYVYFAGRGVAQRLSLRRAGIRIGRPSSVASAWVFLTLWGLSGAATAALACHDLLVGG